MERPAPFLCALVALASAGALLLVRIGTGGSDRDVLAAVASAAARGQQELERCLFYDGEPGAWGDLELAARSRGAGDLWRQCLQYRDRAVRRLERAPNTPAIQAYRRATTLGADLGMCETALALRRALADLQAAAGHEPIGVPATCELSGPPLERVAAPAGETMALVVRREPELVAHFRRDDPSWSHATLRGGAWAPLPRSPERQLLFDPASLVAVTAGDPQPVLHHDGNAWRRIGHVPRGFAVRALRSTADGGLVAVAVAHRDHRLAILRAADPSAPLEVVATRQLDATSGCPELAIHLDDDGTALIAHDKVRNDGWTLEVSRHARGDAEIAAIQVGRFEVEGRSSLHACGPNRWIHRRERQEPTSILYSADGGRSFKKAGGVDPGGALTCLDDGSLLWIGRNPASGTLRSRRYTGDKLPHFEFWPLGGKRAFVSLDRAKLVAFEPSSDEALVWTTASIQGLEDPVGVRGPSSYQGLRNLWRLGDRLLVELPLP